MPEYTRAAAHMINLNPIQRGGILTDAARQALLEFGDGYSVCDYCIKGRLDKLETPPIATFYYDLAKWLNASQVRVVAGNRVGQRIVFSTLKERGTHVIIDSLAHYTTYLAIEVNGLKVKEVPHSGHPDFKLDIDAYAQKIEEVKKETGSMPAAVFLTHVDSHYGNLHDAKAVAKIAQEYDVPFVLNCAYTMGIMPLDMKKLGANFLIGSGHKSMAAAAPTGVVAADEEWAPKVFRTSQIEGDWSRKSYHHKELELLGCTVPGAPLMTLLASFPYVRERVKHFDEEVANAQYFAESLEKIDGVHMLGQHPHNHTLMMFETPSFYEVSKKHPRKGFFLYKALKKEGITGISPGRTKSIELNTYGLTHAELDHVITVFYSIAKENGIMVNA